MVAPPPDAGGPEAPPVLVAGVPDAVVPPPPVVQAPTSASTDAPRASVRKNRMGTSSCLWARSWRPVYRAPYRVRSARRVNNPRAPTTRPFVAGAAADQLGANARG